MAGHVRGLVARGHRRPGDRPAAQEGRGGRAGVPGDRARRPGARRDGPRSPSAASRTAAGSRASPPPSPTRTTRRSSCSASRSTRRARPARPTQRTAHLPAIRCPVLFLSGEADPFARIELLRGRGELLRDAELVTYPRLGHTLQPVLEDALDRAAAFLLQRACSRRAARRRAGAPLQALPEVWTRPVCWAVPQAPQRSGGSRGRTEDVAAGEPDPRARAPRFRCPPLSRPARVLHRSARSPRRPGRKEPIARRGWPPSCGPRGPLGRGTPRVAHPGDRHSASAPPGLERFLYALGQVESGGSYTARNTTTGAYGKYQIMPASWAAWAKLYLGSSTAPADAGEPGDRGPPQGHGSVRLARHVADGRPLVADRLVGTEPASGRRTRGRTSTRSWRSTTRRPTRRERADRATTTWIDSTDARIGETARRSSTRPHGRRPATRRTPASRWYATGPGASATIAFMGNGIAWIGPVGPTRGVAKVYIDGRYVATVDLRRSTFQARKTVFAQTLAAGASHVPDRRREQRPAGRDRQPRRREVTADPRRPEPPARRSRPPVPPERASIVRTRATSRRSAGRHHLDLDLSRRAPAGSPRRSPAWAARSRRPRGRSRSSPRTRRSP